MILVSTSINIIPMKKHLYPFLKEGEIYAFLEHSYENNLYYFAGFIIILI